MKRIGNEDFTNPSLQFGDQDHTDHQPGATSPADVPSSDLPSPGLQVLQSDSLLSSSKLSHLDATGRAIMIDVSSKPDQLRIAKAEGRIKLKSETIRMIRENLVKKGDVLTVAEIAGIQAAKRTSSLIPLCHPVNLTSVKVVAELTDAGVTISSVVHCTGQTGVEMEALTAVSMALLTIYDMCKAVDKEMSIEGIQLIEKTKHDLPR